LILYLLGSGSVIAFTLYNWQVYGTTSKGVLLYFGFPAAGFLASLIFFLAPWREARAVYVFLTLTSLGSAYLFESYVFLFQEDSLRPTQEHASAAELLARSNPIFLPIGARDFTNGILIGADDGVYPLGGVPLAPTAVWSPGSVEPEIYLSDRYGFRNPDSVWELQDIWLAVVGDSIAFGAGSTTEDSFVGRMSSLDPSTINLARGGNGPLSELGSIREYLTTAEPKIVLWVYSETDLQQDLSQELRNPVLSQYLNPDFTQSLALRHVAVASALRQEYVRKAEQSETAAAAPPDAQPQGWLSALRFSSGANPLNQIDFLTLRRTRTVLGLVKGGGDWPDPPQQAMADILGEAAALTAQWGGQLIFVYVPSWSEVIGRDKSKLGFRLAALEAARSTGIHVIDLFDIVAEHPVPKSLWPDRRPGHFGRDGNAFAASEIVRSLREIGAWRVSP